MAESQAAVSAAPGTSRGQGASPARSAARRKSRPPATRKSSARKGTSSQAASRSRKTSTRRPTTRKKPVPKKITRKTVARKKTTRKAAARKKPAHGKAVRTAPARKKTARQAPAPRRISPQTQANVLTARMRELESHLRTVEDNLTETREQLLVAAEQRDQLRLTLIQKEAELQRSAQRRPAPPSATPPAAPSGDEEQEFALTYPPEHSPRSLPSDEAAYEEVAPSADQLGSENDGDDYETYDEEADFLDSDAAILERRRQLDRERGERELELGEESFWMVCPRCGEHLTEHEFDSIKVERCEACSALCVARGEIDLLLLMSGDDRSLAYRARGLLQ